MVNLRLDNVKLSFETIIESYPYKTLNEIAPFRKNAATAATAERSIKL